MSFLARILGLGNRGAAAQRATTAPSLPPTGSPDQLTRGWLPVQSSWLNEILYDSGTLWIRYNSGVICQYQNVPLSMWLGLRNAPSKGKWIHANLIRWPYKLL